MLEMSQKDIIPAVNAYMRELSMTVTSMKAAMPGLGCASQEDLLQKIAKRAENLYQATDALRVAVMNTVQHEENIEDRAQYYKNNVLPAMQQLRVVADELETLVAEDYWPFPTYGDLLFKI